MKYSSSATTRVLTGLLIPGTRKYVNLIQGVVCLLPLELVKEGMPLYSIIIHIFDFAQKSNFVIPQFQGSDSHQTLHFPSFWSDWIGANLRRKRFQIRILAVSDTYLMFIGTTIAWIHSCSGSFLIGSIQGSLGTVAFYKNCVLKKSDWVDVHQRNAFSGGDSNLVLPKFNLSRVHPVVLYHIRLVVLYTWLYCTIFWLYYTLYRMHLVVLYLYTIVSL